VVAREVPRSRTLTSITLLGLLFVSLTGLNMLAGTHLPATWWANFIFVPASLLLIGAWVGWQALPVSWQRVSQIALGLGIIVFTVATILLFESMWFGWTLLIITSGLALIIASLTFAPTTVSLDWHAWLRTTMWWGGVTSLLGVILLLVRLDLVPLQSVVGDFQWWGIVMILLGIGALWNAWWLNARLQNQRTYNVAVLGGLGLLICMQGVLEAVNIT
jgi:hypothetical protein